MLNADGGGIEVVDVLEEGGFGLTTGFPRVSPDQFGLNRLEEGLNGGVMNRPVFTGGQSSRRIARYGTDIKEEDLEAVFA